MLNRRDFIKTTFGACASAPMILPSSLFGKITPNEKINVGFIAFGDRASGLIGGFLPNPACRVVGVCDPKPDHVQNFHRRVNNFYKSNDTKTYANYREMLADKSIDAVVIATPDHNHTPIAIAAARAGKDIYCEKGLSVSMNLRQKLRDAVRENGTVFQYGTQQRSSSVMQRCVEIVRNGYIGNIKHVQLSCAGGGANRSKFVETSIPKGFDYDQWLGIAPWAPYSATRVSQGGGWFIYDYALGFIAGWGAHPLDLMQFALNEDESGPVRVEGEGTIPSSGIFDTMDNWKIDMKYKNGIDVEFTSARWYDKIADRYPMVKSEGLGRPQLLFIGDEGWAATTRDYFRCSDPKLESIELKPSDWRATSLDKKSYDHAANFLHCCRTRERTLSHCEAAIRSDTISHLCDIAVRSGRSVNWNPLNETTGDLTLDKMMIRKQRDAWAV